MRQKVRHAIIKEQGITFAVVSAKDHVVTSPSEAKELIAQLVLIYGGPVILMGEGNRRTVGRTDIVNFLDGIEPSRLPWRDEYIELPSGVSGGGIGSRQPETANWIGRSGASYTYQVQPLNDTSPPDVDGNYIFAKTNAGGWTPLYIGQGRLAGRIGPAHDKWNCVLGKGATHAHFRINPAIGDRRHEEADLLAAFPDAYAPVGCNERR